MRCLTPPLAWPASCTCEQLEQEQEQQQLWQQQAQSATGSSRRQHQPAAVTQPLQAPVSAAEGAACSWACGGRVLQPCRRVGRTAAKVCPVQLQYLLLMQHGRDVHKQLYNI
jgi:hypothetical protein